MAAFKAHCAFGFWKGAQLEIDERSREAMGQFGRITNLRELPADKVMVGYIKAAARLNDSGAKVPGGDKPKVSKELQIPADLIAAMKNSRPALVTFEGFSYTNKKEYVDWISDAKSTETRSKRLATALEWMAEGKIRHWKYVRK